MPPLDLVFDATQANFEADVLQASLQQPILVDFWAPWCAPCLTLGPMLEKIVADFNGAIKLAKVDTDVEAQLAGAFGIRSLPTVVLVKDGQMVDGFMGALPEGQIREFLARHNIVAADADATLADDPDAPPEAATPAESVEETIARLQQEIAAQPDKSELKLDLAIALMQAGNTESAEAELDALPANLSTDSKAKRLRSQLDLAQALKDAPDLATLQARVEKNPDDFAARDMLGVRLLLSGDAAAGLDQFLHILRVKRDFSDGIAKKRLLAAFAILDDEDLVGSYRRKMASLLF
ncbi:co-chaperone YbbN [Pseudolysobacter antarcticus]|uniref:Co-chaperone YbbN n=1 Tax=Pseudolysobacter antarcticus TaxID=2511995 RepID=A0A411HQ35_9GAMM|nr:co-chaperone YbbN [Pseudolysobacter antarcticus]QBB72594.1 co-chaperone YbbN [Pseudolysobacter antarcticus]